MGWGERQGLMGTQTLKMIVRSYTQSFSRFNFLETSHYVKSTLKGKGLHQDVNAKRWVDEFFSLLQQNTLPEQLKERRI